MGSTTGTDPSTSDSLTSNLPDASSPSLILTQPTENERVRVWTMTHPKWGAALTLDNYLGREVYLQTVPLAKEGGLTQWILTDGTLPPDERPILSSCESLRKAAVAASSSSSSDGEVNLVEGIAHGIASVFTEPRFRGRGYASRMMAEVGKVLKNYQAESAENGGALFSVLYSDIGKTFYARNGWTAYPSSHVSFKPAAENGNGDGKNLKKKVAKPIGYHELAELCNADEALLKRKVRESVGASGDKKSAAAIMPSLEQLLWHMMREDYMTKHIFGKTPDVRGAVYETGKRGKRIWAIWSRGYYGGLETIKGNTFHILRFVIEDDGGDEFGEGELVDGFRSIIEIARREAAEWRSEDIQMWNPDSRTRRLIEACGIEFGFVERESDSIASLRWYGQGELDEWVANEKYAWC